MIGEAVHGTKAERSELAGQGFGFVEVAAYNAATKRDPPSLALLLSMGGILGGKGVR
jgi:hypothetical protein